MYRLTRQFETLINQDAPNVKSRILGKRGRDDRWYNLPFAWEVATLVVDDYDVADFDRDVVVETLSELLQRISTFKPAYWPFQYPLLFTRGEYEFKGDISFKENSNASTKKIKFITQLEWVAYRIQQRATEHSTIVFF